MALLSMRAMQPLSRDLRHSERGDGARKRPADEWGLPVSLCNSRESLPARRMEHLMDLSIFLVLLGEQGRAQMFVYLRVRRDREREQQDRLLDQAS